MSDLVDVIWRGGFDAWTPVGEVRPGQMLPVKVPRDQAEASEHFEIVERPRNGRSKPGAAENPIAATVDTSEEHG